MTKQISFSRLAALSALLIFPLSFGLISCDEADIPQQMPVSEQADAHSNAFAVSQLLQQTTHPGYEITDILYNVDKSLKSYRTEGGAYLTTIAYSPDKVIYTTMFNGKKTSDIVYELENQYAINKLETFYTSGGNIADYIRTDYIYQAGKLVKEYYRENDLPDGYLAYYYDDHNVTFQERYDAAGNIVNKTSYEYYLKHVDKSNHFSQFNFKMDAKLFPQKSLNLIENKYLKKPAKVPVATHFTYILNAAGYPTSGTVSGPDPYNWTSIWQ